jgi:hypothetical protein
MAIFSQRRKRRGRKRMRLQVAFRHEHVGLTPRRSPANASMLTSFGGQFEQPLGLDQQEVGL